MESILEQLARYISANSTDFTYTKTSATGNIFIDKLPERENSLSIVSGKGIEDDLRLGYIETRPSLIFRGSQNPLTSKAKLNNVVKLLRGFEGLLVVGGNHVVSIIPNGEPTSMGQDSDKRFAYMAGLKIDYKEE